VNPTVTSVSCMRLTSTRLVHTSPSGAVTETRTSVVLSGSSKRCGIAPTRSPAGDVSATLKPLGPVTWTIGRASCVSWVEMS
jgi:hypothetical protein